MNMNLAVLVGRLTKDLELKSTNNNTKVVSFTLAINEGYGEGKRTEFVDCVAWKGIAEFLTKFARKGDLIGVEGKISSSIYQSGERSIKKTEVICKTAQLFKNSGSNESSEEVEDNEKQVEDVKKMVAENDEPPF